MSQNNEPPTPKFSPANMAARKASQVAIRTVVDSPVVKTSTSAETAPAEAAPEPKAGDVIGIDGKKYLCTIPSREVYDFRTGESKGVQPFTYRSYYSHTDFETGEHNPGWDSRFERLSDPASAMRLHGRTFTPNQINSPAGRLLGPTESPRDIPEEALYVAPDGRMFDISKAMPDTPMVVLEEIKDPPAAPER